MANIYSSITQLVGNTPLVELTNFEKQKSLNAKILGKLEYFNPSGSIKDRAALSMILEAEKNGQLQPGGTILDFTSGNTGIATAAFANARGYRYIVILQPAVSAERTQILKAYGAELVPCSEVPGFLDVMKGGLSFTKLNIVLGEYAKTRNAFYIDQGSNEANPESHYKTTGPEIWKDTDGKIDYFVALVGTGGTLAGVAKYLKEQNPEIKIVGVQPSDASLKDAAHPEKHTIDGVLQFSNVLVEREPPFFREAQWKTDELLSEVINIDADDAYQTGRDLVKSDGIFLGQSAAAAIKAAEIIAKRQEAKGKTIVAVLADNAFKYLSTDIYK